MSTDLIQTCFELRNTGIREAAFKRNYVRKHLGDYPGLENMVSD